MLRGMNHYVLEAMNGRYVIMGWLFQMNASDYHHVSPTLKFGAGMCVIAAAQGVRIPVRLSLLKDQSK